MSSELARFSLVAAEIAQTTSKNSCPTCGVVMYKGKMHPRGMEFMFCPSCNKFRPPGKHNEDSETK